jgi:hypothetical protein
MRLPMIGDGPEARVNRELAIPMIHYAFEHGVNYIDTAVGYCNSDSQRAVGEALKGWRDRIVVSTKNHDYGQEETVWWKNLEDSLERLGVDYLDIYNHHGVNDALFANDLRPRVARWMLKARDQSLVKHVGVSFHDNNQALMKIVEDGYPEVITLQYNLLDRQLEEGIALAHEKGIGIVVMGPVGGGRLGQPSEAFENILPGIRRTPELALRFVLANPGVHIALSGMSTLEQVQENVQVCSDGIALNDAGLDAIRDHVAQLKAMLDLYCTGCGYCMPCPSGVEIPRIFEAYNNARVFGLWDGTREQYAHLVKGDWPGHFSAAACTECGTCEPKCPQHIEIPRKLKEVHAALAPKPE